MGEHLSSMYRWALGLIPNTAKQKQNEKDVALCLFYMIYIRERRNIWYLSFTDGPTAAQRSKVTFPSSHSSGGGALRTEPELWLPGLCSLSLGMVCL